MRQSDEKIFIVMLLIIVIVIENLNYCMLMGFQFMNSLYLDDGVLIYLLVLVLVWVVSSFWVFFGNKFNIILC